MTTEDIFQSIWEIKNPFISVDSPNDWDYTQNPKISDIRYWEIVHFIPGSIGVYAAYDPYIEYYMIYHNLLKTYELFYGYNAGLECKQKLKKYDILLDLNVSWSNLHN